MRPLADFPAAARQGMIGVFTDIDDTLTTEGAITPDALQALADLKAAGLCVVPITGRPVGWSEPFVQSWPVDAIVAENGAVGLLHTPGSGLRKIYQQDADTRARHFARMQEVAQRVLRDLAHEGTQSIRIDSKQQYDALKAKWRTRCTTPVIWTWAAGGCARWMLRALMPTRILAWCSSRPACPPAGIVRGLK